MPDATIKVFTLPHFESIKSSPNGLCSLSIEIHASILIFIFIIIPFLVYLLSFFGWIDTVTRMFEAAKTFFIQLLDYIFPIPCTIIQKEKHNAWIYVDQLHWIIVQCVFVCDIGITLYELRRTDSFRLMIEIIVWN